MTEIRYFEELYHDFEELSRSQGQAKARPRRSRFFRPDRNVGGLAMASIVGVAVIAIIALNITGRGNQRTAIPAQPGVTDTEPSPGITDGGNHIYTPASDLSKDGNPFGTTGSRIDASTLSALPGGIPLPATDLIGSASVTSAWRSDYATDDGVKHTSVVLNYSAQSIRVIVSSATPISDPAKTYKGIADQDGQPSAYQLIAGHPALVADWAQLDNGHHRAEVELVIGDSDVIIQGYQPATALVTIAESMIPS
jgi:hypothetical protein